MIITTIKKKEKEEKNDYESENSSNSSLSNNSIDFMKESYRKKKKKENFTDTGDRDYKEDELNNDNYEIRSILSQKRFHYLITTIGCGFFFIVFLEMSYSDNFVKYQPLFIVFFIFVGKNIKNFIKKFIFYYYYYYFYSLIFF